MNLIPDLIPSYRAESELGALSLSLLQDLERVRPGISIAEIDSAEALRERLAGRAMKRLDELFRDRYAGLGAGDEEAQLDLYRREIAEILLPRYAALAYRQNQAEQQPQRAWQGGDLYNRLAYALIFFFGGVLMMRSPFIPIWEKWIPFVLALISPILTPILPDLYQLLRGRRHQLALLSLLIDLDRAGAELPAPPARAALPGPSSRET